MNESESSYDTSYDSAILLALVPTLMADTHPDHAIPHLLETVSRAFGWHCGEFWSPDPATAMVHCTYRWCDRSRIDFDSFGQCSVLPVPYDMFRILCESSEGWVWISNADTLRSQ